MATAALVTGAGGFVGANLVRALLEQGSTVHALVRPGGQRWRLRGLDSTQLRIHEVDIASADAVRAALAAAQPQSVFHLSHYGGNRGEDDPQRIRHVIIDGTANLYAACQATPSVGAIVNAGSSSEYGVKQQAMREDMVLEPNTAYGVAKAWATLYGQHLAREGGMPIATLRLFSVYGPYESGYRLVPAAALACLRGEPPQLANPDTKRDFVYVGDVVRALLAAAERAPQLAGQIINVGTGTQSTIGDAAELIAQATRYAAELQWGTAAGRSHDTGAPWVADISKAQQLLRWQPATTLAAGIQLTVQWLHGNQALYT